MADYVTLLGAEDVRRAAGEMSSAASEMQRAAMSFDGSVGQQERVLSNFLSTFEGLIERLEKLQGPQS